MSWKNMWNEILEQWTLEILEQWNFVVRLLIYCCKGLTNAYFFFLGIQNKHVYYEKEKTKSYIWYFVPQTSAYCSFTNCFAYWIVVFILYKSIINKLWWEFYGECWYSLTLWNFLLEYILTFDT